MHHLTTTGLTQEEAFMVASKRLGHPRELQEEFSKLDMGRQWKHRLLWLLIGWISLLFVEQLGKAALAAGYISLYLGWDVSTAGWAAAMANILAWSTGCCAIFWLSKKFDKHSFLSLSHQRTIPVKSKLFIIGMAYACAFVAPFGINYVARSEFRDIRINDMYLYYGYTSTFTPVIIMVVSLISLPLLAKAKDSVA